MRANNEQRSFGQFGSANLYGLPECYPLTPQLNPTDYLSAYHRCLSAGCAASVNPNILIQNLIQQGSSLNNFIRPQYLSLVLNGRIRADNYERFLSQARQSNNFGSIPNFNFLSQGPPRACESFFSLTNFGGPVLPNSLEIGSNSDGRSFFPNPIFPSQLPNVPIQPPCPFVQPSHGFPGFPQLRGSFEGCCNRPLCYIPKQDLYSPYSGISPYLSQWNCWSPCDVTCGRGLQNRTRGCVGDGECATSRTSLFEQRACNTQACPVWSSWGSWFPCSQTCGGGRRTRRRDCSIGACVGERVRSERCRTGICPTFSRPRFGNCVPNDNAECGPGLQSGTVSCTNGGAYGCPPNKIVTRPCSLSCGGPNVIGTVQCDPSTCCYRCYINNEITASRFCSDPRVNTRCFSFFPSPPCISFAICQTLV